MPGALRGPGAVPHRRHAGLHLRRAAGAAGAVQLPDRGHPAVHHLRRLFRFRAPGRAGAGDLLRAAPGHHHPRLARRGRPGGAAPLPPVRHRARLHRGRGALAGHRPGLDADDDVPAAAALRGGIRGRGRSIAPPAGEGRRGRRAGPARARSGGRAGAEAQVPGSRGGRRSGAPGRFARRDTTRAHAGPVARQRHRAAGSAFPPRPPAASPPDDSVLTDAAQARPGYQSTRYRADSATVFIGSSGAARGRRRSPNGRASTLEADTITLPARQLHAGREWRPPSLRPRAGAGGEGIRYDTCRRRAW